MSDTNEPIEAPTDADLADANAAATAAASDRLGAAVDELVEKIRSGAASIPTAPSAPVAPATAPVAAPAFGPEQIDSIAAEKGTGAALVEYTRNVIVPLFNSQTAQGARQAKRDAQRDPEIGPLMKRYGPQIDAKIKSLGITDAFLAEHGYDGIARSVAAEDPKFFDEQVEARVAERLKTAPAAPAPTAPAVRVRPTEPVSTGAPRSAAPRSAPSDDERIALIEVGAGEEKRAREQFGMTKRDVQRQRFEIAREVEKHGELGIRKMGGVPICSLADLGLSEED